MACKRLSPNPAKADGPVSPSAIAFSIGVHWRPRIGSKPEDLKGALHPCFQLIPQRHYVMSEAEDASRMSGTLHLAQALCNRERRGRKNDFRMPNVW